MINKDVNKVLQIQTAPFSYSSGLKMYLFPVEDVSFMLEIDYLKLWSKYLLN